MNYVAYEIHEDESLGEIPIWYKKGILTLIPLKRGQLLDITFNLCIESGLFNGQSATLLDRTPKGLVVQTNRGVCLIWRRYDDCLLEDDSTTRMGAFDVRYG